MFIDDLAASPNPQFSRSGWTDLGGVWQFRYDDEDVGIRERWFQHPEVLDRWINVPFPPESALSGINDTSYHPVCWYARQFADTRQGESDCLILNFGAVDYHATVWVDGLQVGQHRGGHTPFAFDVSDALDPDAGSHWIVVRVFDDPLDAEQPRGKQDWLPEPHRIWYHRTTGIWQPVWTETAPATRITRVRWRFDAARWLLDYEIELSRQPEPGANLTIVLDFEDEQISTVQVSCAGRIVVGQMSLGSGLQTMDNKRLLWSPLVPNLIGATLTLAVGEVRDVVQSYVGLRTVELSERAVRINGRAVFLRFVLEQGYWPESLLAAPSPDHLRTEVELILALGFNGARIHQKVEDPRFLYWADRLGLLLWGEMASAFTFSENAIERHAAEWREAVLRDRNHPSIIAWVPFNESWGVSEAGPSLAQREAVHAAYHTTRLLDGTRPVIGNDGWENIAGDLLTIHDYNWDPEILASRYTTREQIADTVANFFPNARRIVLGDFVVDGKPVMVTEFGGVSYAPHLGEEWFGYGIVGTPEDFVAQYAALVGAVSESDLLCGFCYTQLTDTEQETNGLLTAEREPKFPLEIIAAITIGKHVDRLPVSEIPPALLSVTAATTPTD